jgi:hypothetical protein
LVGIALAQHTLGRNEASDAALEQLIDHHGKEAAYQLRRLCLAGRNPTACSNGWNAPTRSAIPVCR